MGANLGATHTIDPNAVQPYRGDWKTELQGVDEGEFRRRFEDRVYDELIEKDPEFKKAVFTRTLFEKGSEEEPKKEEEVQPAPEPAQEPAPEAPPAEPPKEEPKADAPEALWQKEGYSSEEEFLEKFQNLKSGYAEYKEKADRFNAERGRDGNELKSYKDKLSQREKEIEEMRKRVAEAESAKARSSLTIPAPPKFGELDDPEIPEGVKENFGNFNRSLNDYHEGMKTVVGSMAEEMQKVRQELASAKGQVAEINNYHKTRAQEEADERFNRNLNVAYEQAEKLQTDYPELKTKRSFKDIDKDVSRLTPEVAKNTLPAEEFNKWNEIVKAFTILKPVNEQGIPDVGAKNNPGFDDLEDAYLLVLKKSGKLKETINRKVVEAEKNGQDAVLKASAAQQEGAVVVPDSENVGGTDITKANTVQEKEKRMQTLLDLHKQRPLNADEDKELTYLNSELYGKQPKGLRRK
jgi:hypothetical protein